MVFRIPYPMARWWDGIPEDKYTYIPILSNAQEEIMKEVMSRWETQDDAPSMSFSQRLEMPV